MSSIKSRIEGLVYPLLEKYLKMAYTHGEKTVLYGVDVLLDDGANYTRCALMHTAAELYIHYVRSGDKRSEEALRYFNYFSSLVAPVNVKTWGKISVLRAYTSLKRAGLLSDVPDTYLERMKECSDYSDFFNRDEMSVGGFASNYIQVAIAIAAMREYLGWEDYGVSEKATDFLRGVALCGSPLYYTDEEPGKGRFDRYSFLLSSELSDNLFAVGKSLPDWAAKNLTLSAEVALKMANARGDGYNYGRSLSTHGDCAVAEVLSSALSRGLVKESDIPLALAYISKIIDKTLGFWYDEEKESFNIWWNGRSTNKYRQIHRVLEVNLDMSVHLLAILANLERAGLAEHEPDESLVPSPTTWEYTRLDFAENKTAIFLRYKDTLAGLPLIGLGKRYTNSAYMPYPAICGAVEAAPEAPHPFLTPEYKIEGELYRPIEYYSKIEVEEQGGAVTVLAEGSLAKMGGKASEKSPYPFKVCYLFCENEITVKYELSAVAESATMIIGTHGDAAKIIPTSEYTEAPLSPIGEYHFMTPHGQIDAASEITFTAPTDLGYKITLK